MPIDKFGRTLFDRCYDLPPQDISSTTLQSSTPKYYNVPIYVFGESIKNKGRINIFSTSLSTFILPIKDSIIESVSIYPANSPLEISLNGKTIDANELKGKNITYKDNFVFNDPTKTGGNKYLIIFVFKCPLVD